MDYELCSAQLRDMTEQRECSRAQAERLMAELASREQHLKMREVSLDFLIYFLVAPNIFFLQINK